MAATEAGHAAARAVDDLYRQHGADVHRYAYAVLGNHADAEDVTQTTFLNAYRALEQGVRPKKASNWLLTIASNAIKQRFRQEQARPRQVELDERIAAGSEADDEGPSVGELLTALSKIPPKQRQAIVLREFEGRTYTEIAGILSVSTSALETLLFRARRSLAEELETQLTCTQAQLAVSNSIDGRLGRKERRRLRDHLAECPDCAHFARVQRRHGRVLRGLLLIPIPLSFSIFKSLEGAGTATAATLPAAAGHGAGTASSGASAGSGLATSGTAGGGAVATGVTIKAAAVAAAMALVGGVAVTGAVELGDALDVTPWAASTRVERPLHRTPGGEGNRAALTRTSPRRHVAPHNRRASVDRRRADVQADAPRERSGRCPFGHDGRWRRYGRRQPDDACRAPVAERRSAGRCAAGERAARQRAAGKRASGAAAAADRAPLQTAQGKEGPQEADETAHADQGARTEEDRRAPADPEAPKPEKRPNAEQQPNPRQEAKPDKTQDAQPVGTDSNASPPGKSGVPKS